MEIRSREERIVAVKREIRNRSVEGIERRTVRTRVEMRAEGDGAPEFRGHAYVFNDLSENLGFFEEWYERIAPGAGQLALGKSDIRALFNHDPNLLLARNTIAPPAVGWLTAEEDDIGLDTRFVPTPTSYANDLRVNVDAGVVTQMSFAFRLARKGEEWSEEPAPWDEEKTILVRTITQFSEFYDVSPVTYPAYPTTDIGLSSSRIVKVEIDGDAAALAAALETSGDSEESAENVEAKSLDNTEVTALPTDEREDDEAAGQRVPDGDSEERQADEPATQDEPWRLAAAKRRLALRERA